MRILLSFFLVFATVSASAEIIWERVDGFSNRQLWGINKNQGVIILGGMAGDASKCVETTTTTCDTCSGTYAAACNTRRIYPNLEFSVTFRSTEAAGMPTISAVNPNGQQDIPVTPKITPIITIQKDQNVTVTTTWAQLCKAIAEDGADTTCVTGGTQRFKLGIDVGNDGNLGAVGGTGGGDDDFLTFTVVVENPTANFTNAFDEKKGLWNFSLFPGDEKAYIENVQIAPAGRPIAKVHFFSQTGDYNAIQPTDLTTSIEVINNSLSKDFIEGLPNGETRFFYARSEDDAGNIGLLQDKKDADCPVALIPDGNSVGRCRAVTPSAVGGLFKDNCFIATAAYGSKFEPHVATLRQFRDQYLMTHSLGKSFVRFYYNVSPTIADWIAASESRRAVTRWSLTPVVFSVRAFMAAPLMCGFGFLVFSTFFVAFLVRRPRTQPVRSRGQHEC